MMPTQLRNLFQVRSQNCEERDCCLHYVCLSVLSVRTSAWNNLAPTLQLFMKFDLSIFLNLTFIGPCFVILFLQQNQLYAPVYQIYLLQNDTLHVSDGLSVYHQEFKTVHTATGICQTDTTVCLLASCMYSLELLMMYGKTVRNMYSVILK